MGKIVNGILGRFSGKVGSIVGVNWRGLNIIRALPKKSTREVTVAQLFQRRKFAIVIGFLRLLKPIVGNYFGSNKGTKSRFNSATSYHIKEAVTPVGDSFEIMFNKVEITRGDLIGVQSPNVEALPSTALKFNWTDNSGQGQAKTTDRLIVAVYEPETKTARYSLNLGTRDLETADFVLPSVISGATVHCWISIVSENNKLVATSEYLGNIVLT